MLREELEKLTNKELQTICKERGIQYSTHARKFTKEQMIVSILKVQEQATASCEVETKIESVSAVAKGKETANTDEGKQRYFDNLKIGTLVAFREPNGKLNTAAVQNVSYKRKQLKLITQYQKEFIVSFEDVVWIRTSKRWPKFVLDELKGGKSNAVKQACK